MRKSHLRRPACPQSAHSVAHGAKTVGDEERVARQYECMGAIRASMQLFLMLKPPVGIDADPARAALGLATYAQKPD